MKNNKIAIYKLYDDLGNLLSIGYTRNYKIKSTNSIDINVEVIQYANDEGEAYLLEKEYQLRNNIIVETSSDHIYEEKIKTLMKKIEKVKKSEGLGDTIEKITTTTGIKKAVKFIFGDSCGCDERKKKLNQMFPYRVECLKQEEYEYLQGFNWESKELKPEIQKELLAIYNRVFNLKQKQSQCTQCWIDIVKRLFILYQEYNREIDEFGSKKN
jgi:hypothetical protein